MLFAYLHINMPTNTCMHACVCVCMCVCVCLAVFHSWNANECPPLAFAPPMLPTSRTKVEHGKESYARWPKVVINIFTNWLFSNTLAHTHTHTETTHALGRANPIGANQHKYAVCGCEFPGDFLNAPDDHRIIGSSHHHWLSRVSSCQILIAKRQPSRSKTSRCGFPKGSILVRI